MREVIERLNEVLETNKEFGFADDVKNSISQALLNCSVSERVLIMNESGAMNSGKTANKMNKMNIDYVLSVLEVD